MSEILEKAIHISKYCTECGDPFELNFMIPYKYVRSLDKRTLPGGFSLVRAVCHTCYDKFPSWRQ